MNMLHARVVKQTAGTNQGAHEQLCQARSPVPMAACPFSRRCSAAV